MTKIDLTANLDTLALTCPTNTQPTFEDAREWYESYGWHLSTESAGDVTLQAVEYEWLDNADDDAVIAMLIESDESITADEAGQIVERARSVREAAESVCDLLASAVGAWQRRDLARVVRYLSDARSVESEHGDAPATDGLAEQLLSQSPYTVILLTGGDLGSDRVKVRCNLSEASAPVMVDYCEGEGWTGCQYQCADARHTIAGLILIGQSLAARAIEMDEDEFDCEAEAL